MEHEHCLKTPQTDNQSAEVVRSPCNQVIAPFDGLADFLELDKTLIHDCLLNDGNRSRIFKRIRATICVALEKMRGTPRAGNGSSVFPPRLRGGASLELKEYVPILPLRGLLVIQLPRSLV